MKPKRKGFSLIETLTVVTIIGTLANISAITTVRVKKEALDEQWKNDLRVIAQALELYYNDNGTYRLQRGGFAGSCGAVGNGNGFVTVAGCGVGGVDYDQSVSIIGELKNLGYLPQGYKFTNEGPGLDPLLYTCENHQKYALYAYLSTDDPTSVQFIDSCKTCNSNAGWMHAGTNIPNYVVYNDLTAYPPDINCP